jgi:hypothetical protein
VHLNIRELLREESKNKDSGGLADELKKCIENVEEPPMNLVLPVIE